MMELMVQVDFVRVNVLVQEIIAKKLNKQFQQHKYEDRHKSDLIRDTYLRKQGYFVYRVSWNEINSEEGKQMMKDKIELFLDFYEWWKQL